MQAFKVTVKVTEDHELVIQLPPDFPAGDAEVIILAASPSAMLLGEATPEEDKQKFTKAVTLQTDDEVLFSEKRLHAEQIKDARGESIPGLRQSKGEVSLFFVDQEPLANWAHPCLYVLVHPDGAITQAHHYLPPTEAIPLVPLRLL